MSLGAPTIMTCRPVLTQLLSGVSSLAYGSVLLVPASPFSMYIHPVFCGAGPFSCQAFAQSIAALSAHIGAPPGSLQVHPLLPSRTTVSLLTDPILMTGACSTTLGGAAPFKSVMSSTSLIVVVCA